MTDRFADRLRSIRQERSQSSAQQTHQRSDEAIRRSEITERCFVFRERIQAIIESFIETFSGEVNGFEVSKGFYESKYRISISNDELMVDARGEPDKFFSRITFLLAPCSEAETFEMVCKQTVRNRDLESERIHESFARGEVKPFERFIERQFLRFAEVYFTADGTRPVESPPEPPLPPAASPEPHGTLENESV